MSLRGLLTNCHSRENGNLSTYMKEIPAFAGMTVDKGRSSPLRGLFTQGALPCPPLSRGGWGGWK